MQKKLVCGVGVNDADYIVQIKEDIARISGKRKRKVIWICPFYQRWMNLLRRCYVQAEKDKHPAYMDCTMCDEWLTFSNFRAWMETQDWEGKELDKDLLIKGNKTYGPNSCVFVSSVVNTFTLDCSARRGDFPIGVSWDKDNSKFKAQCSNPFTKKTENLGRFSCPQQAHIAWLTRKLELAKMLAAEQDDPRVAKALVDMYENYQKTFKEVF